MPLVLGHADELNRNVREAVLRQDDYLFRLIPADSANFLLEQPLLFCAIPLKRVNNLRPIVALVSRPTSILTQQANSGGKYDGYSAHGNL